MTDHGALGLKVIFVALIWASGLLAFVNAIKLYGRGGIGAAGLSFYASGVAIISGSILGLDLLSGLLF